MKYILIASVALLPAWSAAAAQDSNDFRVRVGLGAQLLPEYLGADKERVLPLVHFNVARGTNEFSFGAPDDSPGIAVVSKDGFSFGPVGNIEGRRRESDVAPGIDSVSRTFEAGAFAQYMMGNSFRVRAEVRKGLNGHDGVVGFVGADKIWRDGDRYVFSIGPRVLFSDSRYQRAYFEVTPEASLVSGLPVYRPGGGIDAVALASGASYALNERWGVFGYGRYARLIGDAAKSPIVRDLGSRNQLSGGLGLSYTFTIKR